MQQPRGPIKSIFNEDNPDKNRFPKYYKMEDGVAIIHREYILIVEPQAIVPELQEAKRYRLVKTDQSFLDVTVLKKRRCGPDARTLFLLEGEDLRILRGRRDGNGDYNSDAYDIFSLNDDNTVGDSSLGIIQPGPSGGIGGVHGYPNAYGITPPIDALPAPGISGQRTVNWQHLLLQWIMKLFVRSVRVAVLDTGFFPLPNLSLTYEECGSSPHGWNFVDEPPKTIGNAFPNDQHPEFHGTRISRIIRQLAKRSHIIPIKIASDKGSCELYDVLCGLEYARAWKCPVVNASFVFPAQARTGIPLLAFMIEKLTSEGIWIVAAAGNKFTYLGMEPGTTARLGDQGMPLLYPACYSDPANQVIAVTAISRRVRNGSSSQTWAISECYSNDFVDIGVVANGPGLSGSAAFDNDFAAPGFPAAPGTSYATAYLSGLLVNELLQHPGSDKQTLLNSIKTREIPQFASGIRRGLIWYI